MKSILVSFILLLISVSIAGCSTNKILYSATQQKAIDNCMKYLDNFTFSTEKGIDTDMIQIKNATVSTWNYTSAVNGTVRETDIDTTDWIITIGDTTENDHAIIVCDSESGEVIGYIPILLQKAIDNSIKYLDNFSWPSEGVDTDIIDIEYASENMGDYVWNLDGKLEENTVDTTDWVIKIGKVSINNSFAIIICDSDTGEVIGFEPTM